MTVNEIITQLQKMISNGEITGNEHFGSFKWADNYGEYFDEAIEICIKEKMEGLGKMAKVWNPCLVAAHITDDDHK